MTLQRTDNTVDFRDVLFTELQKRKSSTPGYSLRRFAKFLSTDPSFLTKLFQKKRNLTTPVLKKFGKRLGLDEEKITELNLNLFQLSGSPKSKGRLPSKRLKRVDISIENEMPIIQWQIFMIPELLTLDHFDATPKNIALALGTNKEQVEEAIVRLQKSGMVRVTVDGRIKLIDASPSTNLHAKTSTPEGLSVATQSVTSMLVQLHLKSISAIKRVAPEKRKHLGLFVAIPSSRVPEAKKLMEKFRDRFETVVQKPGKRDAVYYLATSFFPIFELDKD